MSLIEIQVGSRRLVLGKEMSSPMAVGNNDQLTKSGVHLDCGSNVAKYSKPLMTND